MHRQFLRCLSTHPIALAGVCLGVATFAAGTDAHADVIASYSLTYVDNGRTAPPTVQPGITGSRYFAHGGSQIFTSHNHGIRLDNGGSDLVGTIEEAVDNGVYGEFTVTVGPELQLDLTSLEIGMQLSRGADNESFEVHLRSSLDNYAQDIDVATLMGNGSVDTVNGTGSFDLSGASFQNLTGSITFRLFLVSNIGSRNDGSEYIRVTPNVVLNGATSAIPEPATLALMGLGGVLMLRRRAASRG